MKKSGIYLIINEITKMVYVGQSVDIYQRLRTHKSNLKRKIQKRENSHLFRSVQKYGIENFTFEALLLCSTERLTINEQTAKDFFEKTVGVYNQSGPVDCPNRGRTVSEETKDKIRGKNNPNFGRTGEKHPMFGKRGKLSPNFGENNANKRIEVRLKKHLSNKYRMKSIERIDMKTGEIKEYECINDAKREGFSKSNIILYCQMRQSFHKNYYWRYL